MKIKLFFFCILSLFLWSSCNKDKISLAITSPTDGATFSKFDIIEVNVTASTKKGSITQVVLTVDTLKTICSSTSPYNFLISESTFKENGNYFLSVMAYSSEGISEGKSIYIKIK